MSETLTCRVNRRRQIDRDGGWNGLDYLEVDATQTQICVHFFGGVPKGIGAAHLRLEGGRRITGLRILSAELHASRDPDVEDCLRVTVDQPGDFSTYRLCLVGLDEDGRLPLDAANARFDPRYTCLDFTFKVDCPSGLDCADAALCPEPPADEPALSYLAKDFQTFRQLILDRLSLLMPGWTERHVPDLGFTLVEILAYAGDQLSYYQDAVATEAYLGTARRRVSVRRHARLMDYALSEGCNARAWVRLESSLPFTVARGDWAFLSRIPGWEDRVFLEPADLEPLDPGAFLRFEPLGDAPWRILPDHASLGIYTWGDEACCLPAGTTEATLVDGYRNVGESGLQRILDLRPGEFLLLEEVKGPATGQPEDADPAHRQVVRLVSVTPIEDPVLATTPPGTELALPQPLLQVAWAPEDALRFALCLSTSAAGPDCLPVTGLSVARGNVVLVDEGTAVGPEGLGTVAVAQRTGACTCDGSPAEVLLEAAPFEPALGSGPLVFAQPYDASRPARDQLAQDPALALPALRLQGLPPGDDPATGNLDWTAAEDLLDSGPEDRRVVVEMDDDRLAHLRFGDGDLGARPEAGTAFQARYRVGGGTAGNLGAGSLFHLLSLSGTVLGPGLKVVQPLPATGGQDPEPLAHARLLAPSAFRSRRLRAVTAADYAELAGLQPSIQKAACELRWNGSWYEAVTYLDPLGGDTLDPALQAAAAAGLERVRRIGHDLAVEGADYVPLLVELTVCVDPAQARAAIAKALRDRFSSGLRADGTPGLFHPDRLTFGQSLGLSGLVAEAQQVAGVVHVECTKLERLFLGDQGERAAGVLQLAPWEIPQVDNDPSFPEHGRLDLVMRGGR